MTLLLPLLAFLSGLFLASTPLATRLKTGFSSLLARCFIPIVIVYNMVFYQAGSFSLMLFSFVGCFFVAMFVTPPDALSMIMLAIPMWLLFEVGLFFGKLIEKKRAAEV